MFAAGGSEAKADHQDTNIADYCNCPFCNQVMDKEIFICEIGHSMCGTCKNQYYRCPKCKEVVTASRNFALENIIAKLIIDSFQLKRPIGRLPVAGATEEHQNEKMKVDVDLRFTCPGKPSCQLTVYINNKITQITIPSQ